MTIEMDFRTALSDLIAREARPVDKFGHQPRLYALTRQVGEGQGYDDDVVYAAAWLHDLGVFIGHRPEDPDALARWDHYGGRKAVALIRARLRCLTYARLPRRRPRGAETGA